MTLEVDYNLIHRARFWAKNGTSEAAAIIECRISSYVLGVTAIRLHHAENAGDRALVMDMTKTHENAIRSFVVAAELNHKPNALDA